LKKKWIFSVVCLVFLAVLISFIVNFLKEDEKPKVVVIVKRLDTEYWRIFEAGAQKAFDDFDIDGQVIAPNSIYPITNETNTLKKVLRQHPDALIYTPMNPSITIPVLMEYKKKNIPVLFAGRDADWKDKVTYIGTDHFKLGKMAGELLGSMLQPGNQVALIHGTLKDKAEMERVKGAKQVLADTGIEIATEQLAEDRFGNPISVIENTLQNYPEIQGVLTTSDIIALNVLKAVEKEGLKIPIVGTDGITKMMKVVEVGKLSATVAQNPYDMGYISVEQARKAVKGEYVSKRIDSGVDIITKDNGKDKLEFLSKILYTRGERFRNFLFEIL
jgi:ribose transport system substrate-binding protein